MTRKSTSVPSFSQLSNICELYDIGNLIKVMPQIGDAANINIPIITQTGKYVVKVFNCESKRFDFIMDTLIKLQLNNLPVLMPLKNKSDEYFMEIDPVILQVSKFVYGYSFNYSKNQAISSGRMLRKFHDALSDTRSFIKPVASLYPSADILQNGINQLKKIDDETNKQKIDSIVDLYDEIVGKWEISKQNLPETIIHGDWNQRNLIFDKSEEVCCIMDFEFMTKAERIFDVAYFIWRLRLDLGHIDDAKAFMEGYGPLLYDEVQHLPLEICRIIYYYICASTLSPNQRYNLAYNLHLHYPFIKWIMSEEGESTIRGLCK